MRPLFAIKFYQLALKPPKELTLKKKTHTQRTITISKKILLEPSGSCVQIICVCDQGAKKNKKGDLGFVLSNVKKIQNFLPNFPTEKLKLQGEGLKFYTRSKLQSSLPPRTAAP